MRAQTAKFSTKVKFSKLKLLDGIRMKIRSMKTKELGSAMLKRLIDPTPIDVSSALQKDQPFLHRLTLDEDRLLDDEGIDEMRIDCTLRDIFFPWRIIQRLPKAQELLKHLITEEPFA